MSNTFFRFADESRPVGSRPADLAEDHIFKTLCEPSGNGFAHPRTSGSEAHCRILPAWRPCLILQFDLKRVKGRIVP
jgi:hypothetical protein